MGNIYNSIDFASGYNVTGATPIDSRIVVETLGDLTAESSWNLATHAPYNGLTVSVIETGDVYVLTDKDNIRDPKSWKKQGGLAWEVIDPDNDTQDPERPLYLQTTEQTLDEGVKKQVIKNLGLDTKLDDKLEATVVGSDTTTSEFPVLLAGYQELTDLQKQQVRTNLGMEEYINTLIQKYIETNKE